MRTPRRYPTRGLIGALTAISVSACTGPPPSATPVRPSTWPMLTARLADFRIRASTTELDVGTYTVNVTNDATDPHALQISGPGLANERTPALPPGQTAALTVTLQPGSYELFCPVGDHRGRGMDLTVTVGPVGGVGGPSVPATSDANEPATDTTTAPHGGGH